MHLARLGGLAASACAFALAVTGAAVAVAPASSAAAHTAATSDAAGSSVYSVAPYVDMSNGQEGLLDTAITGHHLKAYTAAFVLGEGCNQVWGDTLPIGNDSYTDPEIAKAKSEGASVIISSGGASGLPLAWTCTTQSSIDAGYQALIDDYGVTQLDFDIEGAAVADTAAAARQMQAMKDLKAANPNLQFSVTLPVLASGLTNDGVNILKAAKNAGVKIDVVNIMTMDYYAGTGTEMGQGSIDAAKATLAQMQSVDSGYGYANLGITPMIGKNDDGSTFTLADAQTVENFAAQNGVGRLAFWSVNRDQPCSGSANSLPTCSEISQSSLAFTDAFVPYEGSSGGGGGGGGGTSSDFSLSLAPGSASVAQGGSATASVATTTTSGSAESVALTASGAPSGVTVSFSPASVTSGSTSTLTAAVGSSVAAGTYPITVTGTGTGGSHSTTYTLTVTSGGGGGGGGGSLANAGFETGSLGPWTCTGASTLVSTPVHSGSHALQVTPDSGGTGECDQTVTLSPNHSYTLTGWVQGPYAYLGVSGGATASTWSNSSSWNQLKVAFTTGSSGTVTVYVHGWYGQGSVYADDLALG